MRKWISCIGLLVLSACASDEMIVPEKPDNVHAAQLSDNLLIHVSFPDMQQATKALSETDESRIDSLRIFIFKDDALAGISPGDIYVDMIAIHKDSIDPLNTSGKVIVKAKKPSAGVSFRFVLVANMPNELRARLGGLTKDQSTVAELENLLRFSAAPLMVQTPTPTMRLPMWGTSEFYSTLPNPPAAVTVPMKRALARIDLGVDINNPAGGDNAIGFGKIFKIDSVFLCNVYDSGYIAPHAQKIDSKTVLVAGYKFGETSGRTMQRTIYAPETDALITNQQGDTIHKPPFVILKASYYDGKPYYYRIDFVNNNAYQPLLRNQLYTINITGVRTVGHETLDKARNAPMLPINPNLIIGNQEATINDIVYSNTYWLGCEATDVRADWDASNRFKIKVATSYPDGWKAEVVSSNSGWLSASLVTTADEIRSTLERNVNSIPRTGTIKVTAGTLTQYITVTQSPGSHTYIAEKGKDFTFPLRSADIDGGDRYQYIRYITHNYAGEPTATPVFYLGPLDYTIYGVDLSQEGIVLVAAYDTNDPLTRKIIWSWTIWVVNDPETFSQTAHQYHYNGYMFMDRNLGAASATGAGLYYQWGRKDPTIDTTPLAVPSDMDEMKAAEYPRNFFTSTASPYDWMTTGQNNNLWTSIDGAKGPYDPCPFGWRVPPAENNGASPWNGFTNGKNSMTIPSGGGLSGTDGTTPTATLPLVWGASARGSDAYLYNATGTPTQAHRTNAYPIRCIRDVKYPTGSLIIE
jgi:hypothetical protein